MPKKNLLILIIVLILSAGGYWYWQKLRDARSTEVKAPPVSPVTAPKQVEPAAKGTLPNLLTNPLGEKAPDLNPVEKANPFKDIYKNPFK